MRKIQYLSDIKIVFYHENKILYEFKLVIFLLSHNEIIINYISLIKAEFIIAGIFTSWPEEANLKLISVLSTCSFSAVISEKIYLIEIYGNNVFLLMVIVY